MSQISTEMESYLRRAEEKAHLRKTGRSFEDAGFYSNSPERDQMFLESPILENFQQPLQNADGSFKFMVGVSSLT